MFCLQFTEMLLLLWATAICCSLKFQTLTSVCVLKTRWLTKSYKFNLFSSTFFSYIGLMCANFRKYENVLQGIHVKRIGFIFLTREFICIQQHFYYSCASLRDCMVMKYRYCGPKLCCLRAKRGWPLDKLYQQNCSCCSSSSLRHHAEPTGFCAFWN